MFSLVDELQEHLAHFGLEIVAMLENQEPKEQHLSGPMVCARSLWKSLVTLLQLLVGAALVRSYFGSSIRESACSI